MRVRYGTGVATAAGVALMAATLSVTTPSVEAVPWSAPSSFKAGNYVVTLADVPAAAYTGTVRGFARTKPTAGKRFTARSAATVR